MGETHSTHFNILANWRLMVITQKALIVFPPAVTIKDSLVFTGLPSRHS